MEICETRAKIVKRHRETPAILIVIITSTVTVDNARARGITNFAITFGTYLEIPAWFVSPLLQHPRLLWIRPMAAVRPTSRIKICPFFSALVSVAKVTIYKTRLSISEET